MISRWMPVKNGATLRRTVPGLANGGPEGVDEDEHPHGEAEEDEQQPEKNQGDRRERLDDVLPPHAVPEPRHSCTQDARRDRAQFIPETSSP